MNDWKERFEQSWKKNTPIRWFVPALGAALIVALHYFGAVRAGNEPKALYMLVWGLAGAVFALIGIVRFLVGLFGAGKTPDDAAEKEKE